MSDKIYIEDSSSAPDSQIGATLDSLYATIESRRDGGDESYTKTLLDGPLDKLLKKISEEALECALAAKDVEACAERHPERSDAESKELDAQVDHLRYECGDVIYHTLVLAARYGIDIDELAAELNSRMRDDERPSGCVLLKDDHIKRRL